MSKLRDNYKVIDKSYFKGTGNRLIRWYFYVNKGLLVFNEFRYLIMSIFGLYYLSKMNNPFILVTMFCFSLCFLAVVGWLFVIKINKIIDYLNVHFSTVWSKHQMSLAEDTVKILEEINDKLS